MDSKQSIIVIRQYNSATDRRAALALDAPATGSKMSLHIDYFGNPASRIQHCPLHLMLVAEVVVGEAKTIVGVVSGNIKSVSSGKKNRENSPFYVKVGYLLGLRVCPSHRRMGVGLKLVRRMEEWFQENGVEYSYMATEIDNESSIRLFTGRCSYSKFRTPSIFVHPVFAHRIPVHSSVKILHLSATEAEAIYRNKLASLTEFFPGDIDAILANPLTVTTILAVPASWEGVRFGTETTMPPSWAILSVWDCGGIFKLEVKRAPRAIRAIAAASRAVDRAAPWLRIPSVPNIFRSFGAWFIYGIGGEGEEAAAMMKAAWREAHNMARGKAAVVAAEVGAIEPLRRSIGRWRRLSMAEDLWCMKRLEEGQVDGNVGDWTMSAPGPSLFVDPRDL